jgi:hypothetical protein
MTTLEIKANKNYDLELTYRDKNGVAIAIVGATGKLTMKKSRSSSTASATITAVLGGGTGEIVYPFVPADTSALLSTKLLETFVYEAEVTLTTGEVYVLLEGNVVLEKALS